ncbi:MAG TPA: methyl-accepting chemotaxis protein [Rhodocyclaceae bacterium]
MRTNLPVTQNEVLLTDQTLIVSKTDLKGRITYINQDFINISGFSEAELIGEPHNLVRHPDMPEEAFADLWRTLKEGRPWTGYVKNRCKNGDYYWVLANATPIYEGGQVTGYMSVRRKASRDVIEQLDRVYRQFREKKQGNLQIRYGQAVKGGGSRLADLRLSTRLSGMLAILGVLVLLMAGLGLYALAATKDNADALFQRRFEPMRMVGRIQKLMADNRSQLLLGAQHDPAGNLAKTHDHPIGQHTDAVAANIAEITQLWESYYGLIRAEEHKRLADAYLESRKRFVGEGLKPASAALAAGDYAQANALIINKVNPLYVETADKAEALFKYLSGHAKEEFADSNVAYERTRMAFVVILALLTAIGVFGAVRLLASIRRPMDTVLDTLRNVTQGNYSNEIDITRNDELGKVLQGLQTMQTRLGFELADSKRVADEMTRVKIALDNVSTGVMIADASRTVIYANKSVVRILKGAEAAIRQQLPNFNAEHMIGVNIDTFHKNPAHQAKLLATFTDPYVANLQIADRHLRVTASPVINDRGERLGAVAEWLDRTAEINVEREVEGIVFAAAQGDFTKRIKEEDKEGFFKSLAVGMNQLMTTSAQGLNAVAEVLGALAQGDLTRQVDGDYQGTFGQLKDDTNTTVERLKEVVGRIQEATQAINTAAQEIAAGNQDLSSRTEEQASSLEETASSMEELSSTVKQNADNAKQANELAQKSNEAVARGGESVKRVVATMSDIQDSSKKIADIIGVIDSIAFQTNILALNAAVEAARAGEQGRGFAVVATEVRNLAQRSATAAKEIKELISASVDKVESGAKQVAQAGTAMDEVVTSFGQVAVLVTGITNASREQASGIEQVTKAVSQMDEVTQQNAALVEEAAAAAESLEEQAKGLVDAVSQFNLGRTQQKPALRSMAALPSQKPAQARPASQIKKIPPPHLANSEDEWEEF